MRTSFLRTSAVVTVLALAGAGGGAAEARTPATNSAAESRGGLPRSSYSDFNGDGYNDVVIGAPFDDVGGVRGAGVVHVIYGGPNGPTTSRGPGEQLWHQNVLGIADQAEANDHFGWAVAAGNFDGDAYGDLAIGVPGEDIEDPRDQAPPIVDFGIVHVLYGSAAGLTAADSRVVDSFSAFRPAGSQFGYALVAADVIKFPSNVDTPGTDGHTELVAGAPGFRGTGSLAILAGGVVDRSTVPSAVHNFVGTSEPGSRLGASVTAGRFDDIEGDDIAVGAPRANAAIGLTGVLDAGVVDILDPNLTGFTELKQPGTTGDGRPETNDQFGTALAVGDVNEDGFDDLAVGIPLEDIGAKVDAGLVQVFFSKADGSGLATTLAVGLGLFRPGVPGDPAAGDHLGAAVAIADLGEPPATSTAGARAINAQHPDVAIGIPGRTVNGRAGAGAVAVLYRTPGGWNTVHNDLWTQDSPAVAETAEAGDGFGSALATGHLRDDSRSLIVGVPGEDLGSIPDAGAVQILFGTTNGVSARGQQFWSQDVPGVADRAQPGDRFGAAVE